MMLVDQPALKSVRKQFQFERIKCKASKSKACKGYTVRIRGRSGHEDGLCTECAALITHERRVEWKESKSIAGIPSSVVMINGIRNGCKICRENYNKTISRETGYVKCPDHN